MYNKTLINTSKQVILCCHAYISVYMECIAYLPIRISSPGIKWNGSWYANLHSHCASG